ncbi:hypothetical protein JCM1841_001809 [Sporobolomyces salmonicolor]
MSTSTETLEPPSTSFHRLTLHSAGSPAPWVTAPSSLPLRPRALMSALLTLTLALGDSSDQLHILSDALERAHATHAQLRRAVSTARDAVLQTSHAAQAAHAHAKRVDKLESVFKKGADRTVASLDRKVARALRKGKIRALASVREGGDEVCPLVRAEMIEEFDALGFVEELVLDLELEPSDLTDDAGPAAKLELDDEWLAMEEELVQRMAVRAREKTCPSLRSSLRLPSSTTYTGGESEGTDVEGDAFSDAGSDRLSLPSTPPSSVHSLDLSVDEIDARLVEDDENSKLSPPLLRPVTPDLDTLVDLLTPLVHPVLVHLFRLRHLLAARLTAAIDTFESLVKASATAVEAHRESVHRLSKNAGKLRDLRDLEQREIEEEERLMEELRTTVVELVKIRKHGVPQVEDPRDGD